MAQKKSLILANHIKEKVISVVAHDLKNLVTAIFAYLQMLSERYDQYDDTKRKSLIQKLSNANKNLFDLVESLMAWITTGPYQILPHIQDKSPCPQKLTLVNFSLPNQARHFFPQIFPLRQLAYFIESFVQRAYLLFFYWYKTC